jgi:hypothetical protein
MVKATVDQVVTKWTNNTKNATQYMTQGVNAVTVSPTSQAAAQLAKARTNYAAAIDSGRMAAALNNVKLSDWQSAMTSKGIPRVSAGVDAAQAKTTASFTKLLPYIQKGQDMVTKMPKTSIQDSKNRVNAWIDYMAAYKQS